MRVLVSGGAGFLGSCIVDGLLRGINLLLSMTSRQAIGEICRKGVPVFEVDICDGQRRASVFDEVRPDWVCYQSAQMSVSRSMREPAFDAKVDVLALLEVPENSSRCGVQRVVFASSGGVLMETFRPLRLKTVAPARFYPTA